MSKQSKNFSKIISQNRPPKTEEKVEKTVEVETVESKVVPTATDSTLSENEKRRLWHLGFKYGSR